ncbi:hypothetical protein WJX75_005683 [Coccomyxa subellipsoidea]|uniref:ABC transporter domain-containing protein n=1 Tax=Coccomyxa subellipsoidea TaxID=248742 RepID=A0ABR2YAJ9_9CHLO
MAAIIGPSGAGKSTLLDALAARSAETVKGTVCIDGVPATAAKRSAESTYIPQVHRGSFFWTSPRQAWTPARPWS